MAKPKGGSGTSDDLRTGVSAEAFRRAYLDALVYRQVRFPAVATANDRYLALASAVRDRLLQRWIATSETYYRSRSRTVCYLSAEFLLGPHLGNNMLNLGVTEAVEEAVRDLGLDLDELLDAEEEPGLGNGGLGRLAACFMESLSTLEIPAIGYGIRYEFGIFDQTIRDGWQVEITDKWLHLGNPWEVARPEIRFEVGFGGHTEAWTDDQGRYRVRWYPARRVRGVAYDTPILGYRVPTTNLLRLWSAEASESFDFQAFDQGDYWGAVEDKVASENLTKVLYPNDSSTAGRRLRLEQQYFFVACSLADMLRIHRQSGGTPGQLPLKYAMQLNDTHPAIAVAELMRILIDEEGLAWESAWDITTQCFGYTNHTLLPEALERWPVELFQAVLPRHLEIIYEVNRRFLDEVRARFPGDEDRIVRMSLIDETAGRSVRMAHLACVGSHAVNGVAGLHSHLLRTEVLRDFAELWPGKFSNKTNGVTPRRFVALVNPGLRGLLDEVCGPEWPRDMARLSALEPLVEDPAFRERWREVKLANKEALAAEVARRMGRGIDPGSLYDVLVKRIHEYKRQHLKLLHALALMYRIEDDPGRDIPPRTIVLGGKAAPGYRMAKLVIRLAHAVSDRIAASPACRGRLALVFIPDYNVKHCARIFPACELSEQISTAGKEASGTGNMKFCMNGALTIGTLDGANVEIREAVGPENFFLFGHTVDELRRLRLSVYRPADRVSADPELARVLGAIARGELSPGQPDLFHPLVASLTEQDPFFVLADFRSYLDTQDEAERVWQDPEEWTRRSIRNTARSGFFSSDRTISEYCREIWRVEPQPIRLPDP